MSTRTSALLLKFKNDTLATVSRDSVKDMAKALGFNETQVLHYALARLREELRAKSARPTPGPADAGDDYPPLSREQIAIVKKHAPKRRSKPLTSESLF